MSAYLRPEYVQRCIAEENSRIAFPRRIERLYQDQLSAYRARALGAGIMPIIAAYTFFIPLEIAFLPHSLTAILVGHVLVSGWMLLVGAFLRRKPSPNIRETMATSLPVAIVAYILFMYSHSHESPREHFHYLAIAAIIYLNVNIRPSFGAALTVSVSLGTAYSLALVLGQASFEAFAIGTSFVTVATYLSLIANWRMGKDARRAFLRRLLEQLLREQAEERAGSDPLTGLANRRRVEAIAQSIWKDAASSEESVAVVLVDVDHFKAFNDTFGHMEGDRCLKLVSAALRSELRSPRDTICRYGGEEFMLLLPGTDRKDGMRVAERVRQAVEQLRIPHASPDGHVTVSVGVMAGPIAYHSFEELTAAADTSLYAAKRSGRNQVWPPFGLLEQERRTRGAAA